MVQQVLEEVDNGLSSAFREALNSTWQALLDIIKRISAYEDNLRKTINDNPDCKKLMALEGISTINAVHLYKALACNDENQFQTGCDASACIGLTPIQYSSGGKIKLGSIGKYVKNTLVRSNLISGVMSMIQQAMRRDHKIMKEQWLKALIEQRGKRCAAVALAMLRDGIEYHAQPLKS